jgi:mannose-1-phosphate guanylyltransferase
MVNRISLIMAGGKGERLWPLSRNNKPKQFLKLIDGKILLESTYKRACKISGRENCYIVAGKGLKLIIRNALLNFNIKNYISEPAGKNTAPCIALSIAYLQKHFNSNSPVIIMPSDHYIKDEEKFVKSVLTLMDYASKSDYICTFGIKPTSIQTGYGHIVPDLNSQLETINKIYLVKKFVEKPDEKTIKNIIEENKEVYWNSGMFVFSIKTIISAFERYMPSLWEKLDSVFSKKDSIDRKKINHIFENITSDEAISIDYGIMNKSDKVCVMEVDFGWDDIGSFESIRRILSENLDDNGNLISGRVLNLNSEGSMFLDRGTPIVSYGLKDIYVITTDDVVLIIPKDASQKVRDILRELEKKVTEGEDWLKNLL